LIAAKLKSEARNSKSETNSNVRNPKFKTGEGLAKILQARGSRHSGEAKRGSSASGVWGAESLNFEIVSDFDIGTSDLFFV
jgi:hypothetical protein